MAHHLPHRMRRRPGVQAMILAQPARHLGGGLLQRLDQRAGIAHGEDVVGRLAARRARISR